MDFDSLIKLVSSQNAPRIRIDSRSVESGDCFVAIKGTEFDGHNFIAQAISAGAKYIITQKPVDINNAEIVLVDDTSQAAAILAQARNSNPSKQLINLAVTGTNGKTTVAFLVRSIINSANTKCGMIGTVHYDTGLGITNAPLTTPDCITIADAQKQMVTSDLKYMIIEASSHALYQNRLAAIDFTAAAFTNLTGDHLDYHKTEQAYLDAKAILFENLSENSTAILNSQSPHSKQLAQRTKAKVLYYGIDDDSDITAYIEKMDITGTIFNFKFRDQTENVKCKMPGEHNVSNCLAAAGLCIAVGFDLKTIANGLSNFDSVPGRLEKVDFEGNFTVLIDYAHTDDALKNVLSTLRPICKGRLIVVFGCGGDRDRTKRPRMAKVAEQLADIIIVTSDNPRTENPNNIINDITKGFVKPCDTQYTIRNTNIVEPDRAKAIELSVNLARKDDIVLIAGKGHEDYQIIGKEKVHFSDKETVEKYLKKLECKPEAKGALGAQATG
jgi:UDP-N-acetylmuramoyl-L-alanyl-D-glutamate--2,6-diaminopimelate ligase